MHFYVSITTIKKYKAALDMMLASLPTEWKNKYILIYQDEEHEDYTVFDDGHIEVYIKNNLSDYGNWVGVHRLLEKQVIPSDSWFLFVHDTCKFLDNTYRLTNEILDKYKETDVDILWLCNNGQCNICLIRKKAIDYGNTLYRDIPYMNKTETIHYEWNHQLVLSPKSFKVKQQFLENPTHELGKRYVYNQQNNRNVLMYPSIDMEKYYFHPSGIEHPMMP